MSEKKYFAVRHRVAFSETDMAGIAHFSNYFRYMELAEAGLFRHLEETLIDRKEGCVYGWPRVRASCDFRAPITFGDEIEIRLMVSEIKIRAIEFFFQIFRIDNGICAEKVAKGKLTTVHVVRKTGQGVREMEALAIPEAFVEKLKTYQV